MSHDWMRDRMEELRLYARAQGLSALEAHLDEAAMLLEVELANQPGDAPDCVLTERA